MWLRDARLSADGADGAPCWVEVVPTGAVRPAGDPPPEGSAVLDAAGAVLRPPAHGALADALVEAIVTGDVVAADRLYADDLVVWHNHDRVDRDKRESLALIDELARDHARVEATDIRRDYLADGYVQRTVFCTVGHDGTRDEVDAMMRVWVAGGRITRIEEYTVGPA